MAWDGTRYVAVGAYGTVLTSTDAKAWTSVAPFFDRWLLGVAWNGRRWVAVGEQNAIFSSTDAISWTVMRHCVGSGDAAARLYFTESAETILMLCTSMRFLGLLFSPVALGATGVFPIFSSTSSPLITLPKAVYLWSRCGA